MTSSFVSCRAKHRQSFRTHVPTKLHVRLTILMCGTRIVAYSAGDSPTLQQAIIYMKSLMAKWLQQASQ